MKNKHYILLIILTFFATISCNKKVDSSIYDKELYVFWSDSLMNKQIYRQTVKKTDSLIKHYFNNLEKSEKDMEFNYYPKLNKLISFLDDEFKEKGTVDIKFNQEKVTFKKFRLLYPEVDGTELILFNKEYGVLAVLNSYAPDLFYLPINKNEFVFDSIVKDVRSLRYE
ncbi:hypothetical protein [Olleya sp. R77988]|uniref:hypothetical protein n=1 Tax=Olleya sp. R77988 TaxID=3093875 RepID=UPI0037C8225E